MLNIIYIIETMTMRYAVISIYQPILKKSRV